MTELDPAIEYFDSLTPAAQIKFLQGITQADFNTFAKRAFNTLRTPVEWNWHIDAQLFFADRIAVGDFRFGMVNIPPRSLKSGNLFDHPSGLPSWQGPTLQNHLCQLQPAAGRKVWGRHP